MNFLVFLPPRLGGIDLFLPLLFDWTSQVDNKKKILLVFPSKDLFIKFKNDKVLSQSAKTISSESIVVDRSNKLSFFLKLLLLSLKIFSFWLDSLRGKKLFTLHSDDFLRKLLMILKSITLNSEFYHCPKVQNFNNATRKTKKTSFKTADKVLIFNEEDKRDYELSLGQEYKLIGFPRFYQTWVNFIKGLSSKDENRVYRKNDALKVAVLMSSTLKDVFSDEEMLQWTRDIVESLDNLNQKYELIIKPHPMLPEKFLNEISNQHLGKIAYSYEQVGFIADQANLVLLRHSSTIIDTLCVGTHTIFYQEFTDHWLKRHPLRSHFLPLVKNLVENKSHLTMKIKEVLNWKNERKEFNELYAEQRKRLGTQREFPI